MNKRRVVAKYLTGYSTHDIIGVLAGPTLQESIEEIYMRYLIQPTPDGKFDIVRGLFNNFVARYDSYETAKSNLEWHLHEERIERRAERAFEAYIREHGDE